MARLNTTVENIQLKENMIIASATETDWDSDSKYPSAKAVTTKLNEKLSDIPGSTIVDTNQTVKTGAVTFGANDIVEFVAGSNVSISGDATNKKITISSTDTNTEATLTITDKTNTDTSDLVYAITNLVEGGTKGHTITPTFVGLPTKTYVDKVVTGTVEYLGTVSALTDLSTTAGKGDFYRVLTAFTVGSEPAHVGDLLIATKDNPAQNATDWDVIHAEINSDTWVENKVNAAGYVTAPGASNANKVWKTDGSGNPGWRDDANSDTGATSVEVTGTGNAVTTATYDTSSRKLTLTKGATYNNYSHPNSGVTAGTYSKVTVDAQGHVTAGNNPTTLSGYAIADAYTKNEVNALIYPVGSVIMTHKELVTGETSAVANPNTLLGLPGTWTLIDKTFKTSISRIGGPGNEFSSGTNGFALSYENAIRSDHTLILQLGIYINDSADKNIPTGQEALAMANLTLARYGIYGMSYTPQEDTAFAINTTSNTASSTICYRFDNGGSTVSLRDVINGGSNTHTLNKNARIHINTIVQIPHADMIDSFCDKFYWKRTA